MAGEWVSLVELAARESLNVWTLRHLVAERRISFRRRGAGKRGALEFNYPVVKHELQIVLETTSRTAAPTQPASPTLFSVLTELHELKAIVLRLEGLVSKTAAKS